LRQTLFSDILSDPCAHHSWHGQALPAAILARQLGIHISVAVAWQRASSGDWTNYAAESAAGQSDWPDPATDPRRVGGRVIGRQRFISRADGFNTAIADVANQQCVCGTFAVHRASIDGGPFAVT